MCQREVCHVLALRLPRCQSARNFSRSIGDSVGGRIIFSSSVHSSTRITRSAARTAVAELVEFAEISETWWELQFSLYLFTHEKDKHNIDSSFIEPNAVVIYLESKN